MYRIEFTIIDRKPAWFTNLDDLERYAIRFIDDNANDVFLYEYSEQYDDDIQFWLNDDCIIEYYKDTSNIPDGLIGEVIGTENIVGSNMRTFDEGHEFTVALIYKEKDE